MLLIYVIVERFNDSTVGLYDIMLVEERRYTPMINTSIALKTVPNLD